MDSIEEKLKSTGGFQTNLLEEMKQLKEMQDQSGARKAISSELWHACAGPLVSLPLMGSLVYYFPQGHSEQVAVSTKRMATSQIPNYPNLPAQLMCQVQNITLHADKDTDEIYAQMCLQPVNSEKDVFPVRDFGIRASKHPSEFFCKTLTASDTSTHGGFSVPRRAAEKLFPSLDYSMQPPTQELVVRDLHDNTWNFRHIYRGQPKRHLLTTGWSLFVGAKRLRAGDSVLFIRDEKSQLLVGVRRANRQQTTLPSSVLSADSMHIGVLAAAAHAAANRSPFTIFYNPRACPSEFVIPLTKFRKSVYGSQLSAGMRFGMMFETEESSKRRYMGTIIGISDLDPLRWPGSKWRNLQVEWDEPGCCDKQNRVCSWEIETPESLFIFPSLTSGLKRPLHSGFLGGETDWGSLLKRPFVRVPENRHGDFPYSASGLYSEQLMKMMVRPQLSNPPGSSIQQESVTNSDKLQNQNQSHCCPDQSEAINSKSSSKAILPGSQIPVSVNIDNSKLESEISTDQLSQLTSNSDCRDDNNKLGTGHVSLPSLVSQNQIASNPWPIQPQFEPIDISQYDFTNPNTFLPSIDTDACIINPPYQTSVFPESLNFPLPSTNMETWDHLNNFRLLSQSSVNYVASSDESNNQSGIYSGPMMDITNGGNVVVDPSVSSKVLDEYCTLKDSVDFQSASDCLVGNFSSSQDVQSQITSVSLGDSQAFTRNDFADNSGGTSSCNVDFDDSNLLQSSSWKQVVPPMRTYTKVQKAGSVGRSIDVTSFKNYDELCSAIECMFGLEGLLNDPRGSGWKLVYVDYENDVLLVGDDPWEEFVSCVRCIRILSPSEVQQMSEEGMKLLNSAMMQGIGCSLSEGGHV